MTGEANQSRQSASEADRNTFHSQLISNLSKFIQENPAHKAVLSHRGLRRIRRFVLKDDPWERLRQLPDGSKVRILKAGANRPSARYAGQTARKVRTPGAGAYRMVIELEDGREAYWPMDWLEPLNDGQTGH